MGRLDGTSSSDLVKLEPSVSFVGVRFVGIVSVDLKCFKASLLGDLVTTAS